MKKYYTLALLLLLLIQNFSANAQELHTKAKKINKLEKLILKAEKKGFDVTREVTLIWFRKEFLKIAKCDEANTPFIQDAFKKFTPIKGDKVEIAKNLSDFKRQKVIEILDKGISNLVMEKL